MTLRRQRNTREGMKREGVFTTFKQQGETESTKEKGSNVAFGTVACLLTGHALEHSDFLFFIGILVPSAGENGEMLQLRARRDQLA